jgi:hypothetical protein
MMNLHVDRNWMNQIRDIRACHTEAVGGTCWRICEDAPDDARFPLRLCAPDRRVFLDLGIRKNNLYIDTINNTRGFNLKHIISGPVTKQMFHVALGAASGTAGLDAINALPSHQISLILFCVAESLRFDQIARQVHHMLWSNSTLDLYSLRHLWGNWSSISDAIFLAQPRDVRKRIVALEEQQRAFDELSAAKKRSMKPLPPYPGWKSHYHGPAVLCRPSRDAMRQAYLEQSAAAQKLWGNA